MSADHWHYAYEIHGGAQEHHRHHDNESQLGGLREDLRRAEERIRDLEDALGELRGQIRLASAPGRQAAERELAAAMADLTADEWRQL